MDELKQILEFTFIYWTALVTPGPNMAMIVRSCAEHTPIKGFCIALGFSCGIFLHGVLVFLGTNWFFEEYPSTLKIIQIVGALYLGYLGIKGLMSRENQHVQEGPHLSKKAYFTAFRLGFLTHLLNPFAIMAVLSLFSTFYTPVLWVRLSYIGIFSLSSFIWYGLLSLILTNSLFQKKLFLYRHWIARLTGIMLLYFAYKMISADF